MQDDPRNKSLRADFGGAVDDVGLQGEIVVEEVGGAAGVGMDAADPRRSEDDHVGLCLVHPGPHLGLVAQVEAVAIDGDELAVLARQPAHQRRPDHPAMTGNPDPAPFDAKRQLTPGHSAVSPAARVADRIPSFPQPAG